MVDRSKLPPDVDVAIQWIAIDLPNIVNELGKSLSGIKQELKSLTREIEEMEKYTELFKASVADVRSKLGLT